MTKPSLTPIDPSQIKLGLRVVWKNNWNKILSAGAICNINNLHLRGTVDVLFDVRDYDSWDTPISELFLELSIDAMKLPEGFSVQPSNFQIDNKHTNIPISEGVEVMLKPENLRVGLRVKLGLGGSNSLSGVIDGLSKSAFIVKYDNGDMCNYCRAIECKYFSEIQQESSTLDKAIDQAICLRDSVSDSFCKKKYFGLKDCSCKSCLK